MANLSNINNKFLVTTGGNVLIGQTSAIGSSILQVTGNSTFTGSITAAVNSFKCILDGSANALLDLSSTGSQQIRFFDTNSSYTEAMRLLRFNDNLIITYGDNANEEALTVVGTGSTAGYVGIGTTSPDTLLHVSGSFDPDDGLGYALIQNTSTSGSSLENAGINVKNHRGTSQFMQWEGNGLRIGSRILTNSGIGDVYFTAGADSVKMVLKAGGNVGIGTTSPDGKLQVTAASSTTSNGNDASYKLYLTNTDTTNNNYSLINFTDSDGGSSSGCIGLQYIDHTNDYGDLCFITRGASGYGERLRIDSSGNVGIGITPSPSSTVVDVLQLGKGMTIMGNVNDDRATMAANLYLDAGTAFRRVMDGFSGRFSIEDGTMLWGLSGDGNAGAVVTVDTKMTLLNNGNLGIGTTSPDDLLTLAGNTSNYSTAPVVRFDSTSTDSSNIRNWAIGPADSDYGNFHIFKSAARGGDPVNTASIVATINKDGNVGIGTASPGDYDGESDDLVVFNSTTPGITIATDDTTSRGALRFADGTTGNEAYRGGLEYDHNTDLMMFRTKGAQTMTLYDLGRLHPTGGVFLGSANNNQLLSYYKEDTWTPSLKFGGAEVGITYAGVPGTFQRGGHYTRIGRIVTFCFRIILTSKGTSVGAATITGLPDLAANLPGNYGSAMYSYANNFAVPERALITIDVNSSDIRLRFTSSTGIAGDVGNSDFSDNSDIILTGTYQAAPA